MTILSIVLIVIRAIQVVVGFTVLGLMGYVRNWMINENGIFYVPSQTNFILAVAGWSVLLAIYLLIVPLFVKAKVHAYFCIALETLTALLWFGAFLAWTIWLNKIANEDSQEGYSNQCDGVTVCNDAKASTGFSAAEWILWSISTIFAAIAIKRA